MRLMVLMIAMLFEAIACCGQSSSTLKKIHQLNKDALVFIDSDPINALKLADSSLMLSDEAGNEYTKAVGLKTKALVLIALGQLKEAESTIHISLALAESLGDKKLLAQIYHTIGYIKMDASSATTAYNFMQRAYNLNVSLHQNSELPKNLLNMAILNYWLLKQKPLGLKQLTQALSLATRYGNHKLEAEICSNMSAFASGSGNNKQALIWLKRSNIILTRLGNIPSLIFNIDQEARIAIAVGDLREAGRLAQKAVDLGEASHMRSSYACALRTASGIYKNKGDYQSAFDFYSRFFEIDDSINKAEKSRLVGLSYLVLQTERQKRQNNLLLKDQQQKQETLSQQQTMLVVVGLLVIALSIITIFIINKNAKVRSLVGLLQEQNYAINTQKIHIEELNSNLEKTVSERTFQLETRTRQILDYASYNSHNVRGPLARILGLASLMQNAESIDEKTLFVHNMELAAQEMDIAIKNVNRNLAIEKSQSAVLYPVSISV